MFLLLAKLLHNFTWFLLQTISYMAERVVGQGSFGVVFQVYYFILFITGAIVYLCLSIYPSYTHRKLYVHNFMIFLFGSAGKMLRDW